ncbi:MAG: hypothetical protein J6T37_00415 [Bacteroidales bacterium]|nr:hypothetical protein [Bacteroidales bacterium]
MFWKIFSILIAATVKTFFAPAAGFAEGLSFGTTFAATAIGGIIGFLFFYYFFDAIFRVFKKNAKNNPSPRRMKAARNIAKMRRKYPVWLFVLVLPITSIPVMAVIVRRYFRHDKQTFALSLLAVTLFAIVGCLVFSPIQLL